MIATLLAAFLLAWPAVLPTPAQTPAPPPAALMQSALARPAGVPAQALSLVFGGDVVLDDVVGDLIARGGDPMASVAALFQSADVRLVNLECVVANGGEPVEKNFTFRAHPRVLPWLRRHVDAVALANNHSGDFGRGAFAEMLGLLRQAGLGQFGGGHNLREAHTPWILERGGLRIALLGYNEYHPRSFEADHDAPGSAWSDDEQVVADIRAARQVHRADLVIPVMHWGWENETQANARQRQLARLMIDAGADAVIGGHPHVTQDIEIYRDKPIIYSVGNFVMLETDGEHQRRGWVLRLWLDASGALALDTHVVRLDLQGIPHWQPQEASPRWQRAR